MVDSRLVERARTSETAFQQLFVASTKQMHHLGAKYPELHTWQYTLPRTFYEGAAEQFVPLVGRDSDIRLRLAPNTSMVAGATELPCSRDSGSFVFNNPYTTKNESWGHFHCKDYPKHNKPNGRASWYTLDRESIETLALQHGSLHLDSPRLIEVFASFDKTIGTSGQRPTSLVRVRATRSPTNKGYYTSLHGHPITEQELFRQLDKKYAERILENSVTYTLLPKPEY